MRARKSAAASRSVPSRHPVAHEVGHQERRHQLVGLVRLDGQAGQQYLGLGLEDPLEHLVLEDGVVGEDEAPLHHLFERLGIVHLLVEAEEEAGELPPHHGADELVAPAREVAVDGGPGHARLPGGVLDRGLGQSPAGHAVVGGLQEPLPHVTHAVTRHGRSQVEEGFDPDRQAGAIGHRPHGQEHAGHEGAAVVGVVADGEALPEGAEDDLFVGDQPGQAHRMDVDATGALGAPGPRQHELGGRIGGQRPGPALRRGPPR